MTTEAERSPALPAFLEGISYIGEAWPEFARLGAAPAVAPGKTAVDPADDAAAYQTVLTADALRYLALQVTGGKASGHPGGFASWAEGHAALYLLGHKHLMAEPGHHAPGYYGATFLDGSLEAMGIRTVKDLVARFRERGGLLGHPSGAIPGLLAPSGPLGQGQHFAMGGAYVHRDTLFAVTLGDGGLGEPYPLPSMMHFHTAFPEVTNFLPILVWNGYSQEHHAMISRHSNDAMADLWRAHGFEEIVVIDAKDFDDAGKEAGETGAFVDSTRFSLEARMAYARGVLQGFDRAARSAMSGTLTAVLFKQLKGAGVHARGAKSHNLYPGDTLDQPHIAEPLKALALAPEAWALVRDNLSRAGGGPAAKVITTERETLPPPLPKLTFQDFGKGDKAVPSTAMGAVVAQVGKADPRFVVTSADGNEASGMKNVNDALKVRHPTPDPLYNQDMAGQVYEPLNEDACAGLAASVALMGGRTLWLSYESFAINGVPLVQTVTQAMAELRRKAPSVVCMFTAGALEQGRNGWTHERPEIENYFAALMRNGNVYPLFPCDANTIQAAYAHAAGTFNKGYAIFASKSPLPVHLSPDEAKAAVEEGAAVLYESPAGKGPLTVFAVTGDMVLLPVFEAKDLLEARGARVRIVAMVNPRRLYRPGDLAWNTVSEPDGAFMADAAFTRTFGGDALVGVSGGAAACLEPVLLRATAPRDVVCWKRGETTATPGELLAFNGITADALADRAAALAG
jgi:phosphoketolase